MSHKPKSGMSWQALGFTISLIFAITAIIVDVEVGFERRMRGSGPTAFGIRDIANIIVLLSFAFFATRYFAFRRKSHALDAQKLMVKDVRPPVLYLRSFKDDSKTARIVLSSTEEEQLAMVMGEIGTFIALGRPDEEMPELGAARMYVDDDAWQETVSGLMLKAQLVVLRIGATEGFWWEVQRAVQQVKPERLLFLVPHDKNLYEDFRHKVVQYLPVQVPEYKGGAGAFASLNGILYFEPDWTPHFIKIPAKFFSHILRAGLKDANVPVLKLSLRPIFEQLNVTWNPQPIRLGQVFLFGWFLIMLLFAIRSLF